ncbi:MAG: NAD(+)/NADH kinase [Proteobacteria bacterium]|nr:NAD(+)/NADH kinase [Pseudomonadota bacterium]
MAIVGLLANPSSGKDVRRLVARASVFDNQEKQAIVRRVIVGAMASGAKRFVYLDDPHGIVRNALAELGVPAEPVDATATGTALDTISAARAMRKAEVEVVITLGGDGTNRAFCLGWPDAVLLPVSTGTNNVFPVLVEATIAGAAAGLLASGALVGEQLSNRQKLIQVQIEGERDDIALIDAVLTRERFIGARALLNPEYLAFAALTRADPAAVGITSIGGLLQPVSTTEDIGLVIEFARDEPPAMTISAPLAPGYYRDLNVASFRTLNFDQPITLSGPGVLAFDGERERELKPGQQATLRLNRNGPRVVDVNLTMRKAAHMGLYHRRPSKEKT